MKSVDNLRKVSLRLKDYLEEVYDLDKVTRYTVFGDGGYSYTFVIDKLDSECVVTCETYLNKKYWDINISPNEYLKLQSNYLKSLNKGYEFELDLDDESDQCVLVTFNCSRDTIKDEIIFFESREKEFDKKIYELDREILDLIKNFKF